MTHDDELLLRDVLLELLAYLRAERRSRERDEDARQLRDTLSRRYGYPAPRRRWR